MGEPVAEPVDHPIIKPSINAFDTSCCSSLLGIPDAAARRADRDRR